MHYFVNHVKLNVQINIEIFTERFSLSRELSETWVESTDEQNGVMKVINTDYTKAQCNYKRRRIENTNGENIILLIL